MNQSCNDDSCCPNKDKFASETHAEDRTDVTNACVFKYLVYANLCTQTLESWDASYKDVNVNWCF